MESPKLIDNNMIIDNKAGNGTFDYVDLLPTELWRIIIFHLGEGESARLARCCKKLNNYVSNIKNIYQNFSSFWRLDAADSDPENFQFESNSSAALYSSIIR